MPQGSLRLGLALVAVAALAIAGAASSQALAGGLNVAGALQTTSPEETTIPTPDPAPKPAPKPPPKPAPKPSAPAPVRRSTPVAPPRSTPAPEPTFSTPTSTPSVETQTSSTRRAQKPVRRVRRPVVERPTAPTPLNPVVALHRLREGQSDQGRVLGVTVALGAPFSLVDDARESSPSSAEWMVLLSVPLGIGLLLLLGAMTPAAILHRSTHLRGLMIRRTDLAAYGVGITVTIVVAYLIAEAGQ